MPRQRLGKSKTATDEHIKSVTEILNKGLTAEHIKVEEKDVQKFVADSITSNLLASVKMKLKMQESGKKVTISEKDKEIARRLLTLARIEFRKKK